MYLVDVRENQVELLRVVDGVSERTVPMPFSSEQPLILDRGLAIATETADPVAPESDPAPETDRSSSKRKTGKELTLRWYRLSDMQRLVEQPLVRNARKLLLDPQTLGILQPDKTLVWFNLVTGAEQGRAPIDVPGDVSQVHVWQDPYRFYILPSGIPPKYNLHRVRQIRSGYRQHLVHGTLHAIDRKTGQVAWRKKMEETFVAQDQPRGAPIFLFNYQTLAPNVKEPATPPNAGELEGVIHVVERRTGEDVYFERDAKLAPDFTVELNTEDHWMDIHGVTERIRVEYPRP